LYLFLRYQEEGDDGEEEEGDEASADGFGGVEGTEAGVADKSWTWML
jgi:hypothetical protein